MDLFLLIGVLLGLVFTTIGLKEIITRFNSGKWMPVQATVLTSGVDESTSSDGSVSEFSIWLKYEYSYLGRKYQSPKIYLSHNSMFDSSDAQKFLLDSPFGSQRTVWVSDKFPQKSTPEQSTWLGWAIGGVFGVALICFALLKLL